MFLAETIKTSRNIALTQIKKTLIFLLRNCVRRRLVIRVSIITHVSCWISGCGCRIRCGGISCGCRVGCRGIGRGRRGISGCRGVSCGSRVSSCGVSRCCGRWPGIQRVVSCSCGVGWGVVSGIGGGFLVVFLLCLVVGDPHFHVEVHMGVTVILWGSLLFGIQQINPGILSLKKYIYYLVRKIEVDSNLGYLVIANSSFVFLISTFSCSILASSSLIFAWAFSARPLYLSA